MMMMPDQDRRYGGTLDEAVHLSACLQMVRRGELRIGDSIVVRTVNSLYQIRMVGINRYSISGGWFDRKGAAPAEVQIAGCTWGGSIIKMDVVAACGLCIEFGNRVTTSMVKQITIIPRELTN
jgi:hypothetical protein